MRRTRERREAAFFALKADSEETPRFRLDDEGRATGFTLLQGDLVREAVRIGGWDRGATRATATLPAPVRPCT